MSAPYGEWGFRAVCSQPNDEKGGELISGITRDYETHKLPSKRGGRQKDLMGRETAAGREFQARPFHANPLK